MVKESPPVRRLQIRPSFFGNVLGCTLTLALASCGLDRDTCTVSVKTAPNIVLFSIDTLRPDHLGCYGYSRNTSPNIDQLASEGVVFEVVTSSSSWTLPAHAALLTGLPDSVHGCDRGSRVLGPDFRTMAEGLQSAGYQTAGFWSGPLLHPHFGLSQGFDEYVSCSVLGEGTLPDGSQDMNLANHQSHEDVTSPRILEKVSYWLENNAMKPFPIRPHVGRSLRLSAAGAVRHPFRS